MTNNLDKHPVHHDETFVHRDETSIHLDETSIHLDKAFIHHDEDSIHCDESFILTDETSIHIDKVLQRLIPTLCAAQVHSTQSVERDKLETLNSKLETQYPRAANSLFTAARYALALATMMSVSAP